MYRRIDSIVTIESSEFADVPETDYLLFSVHQSCAINAIEGISKCPAFANTLTATILL